MHVVFVNHDGDDVLWAGRLPFRPHDWDIVRFAGPDALSRAYQVIGVSYVLESDQDGDDPTLHAYVAPYDQDADDRIPVEEVEP